jgi:hypothetical protein
LRTLAHCAEYNVVRVKLVEHALATVEAISFHCLDWIGFKVYRQTTIGTPTVFESSKELTGFTE